MGGCGHGAIRQDYDAGAVTKFTQAEQRTMMTLWSIFRSPLMIGGEMTKFDDFTMGLLTNEALLAMHENSRHAHQVWRRQTGGTEIVLWTAVNADGGQYAAVFNIGDKDCGIELDLEELEIYGPAALTEIWSGEKQQSDGTVRIRLGQHDCKAFLIV